MLSAGRHRGIEDRRGIDHTKYICCNSCFVGLLHTEKAVRRD